MHMSMSEGDNLMLCNFSNNTGSNEELFSHVGPLGLNINLVLMWPFRSEGHHHSWYWEP